MSNQIECATCGYPLTPEERITLVEVNGKMRKPWVGLTPEEIDVIFELHRTKLGGWDYSGDEVIYYNDFENAVVFIEAKLKEKNT